MIYQKFARLVEENAATLTQRWINEVKQNPSTAGYKTIPDEDLRYRAFDDYEKLGKLLLENDPSYKSVAEHYIQLGKNRAAEGMKFSEVVYALILSRVVLWDFVVDQGLINNMVHLQIAMDFMQRVTSFYDKAVYFVSVGYEEYEKRDTKAKDDEQFVDQAIHSITRWFIDQH